MAQTKKPKHHDLLPVRQCDTTDGDWRCVRQAEFTEGGSFIRHLGEPVDHGEPSHRFVNMRNYRERIIIGRDR